MSEWDDLVKALDDFIKWGDYFFEEERKTKEEPEEEPEMETKWEYAEDSDFEDSPKKTFGLNNVYLFKAKIIGGWMMRMYVLDNYSWGVSNPMSVFLGNLIVVMNGPIIGVIACGGNGFFLTTVMLMKSL